MAKIIIPIGGKKTTLISTTSAERLIKKAKKDLDEAEEILNKKVRGYVNYEKLKSLLIDAIVSLGNVLQGSQFR